MKTIFQFLFLLAIACAHLDSSQAENGTKQVTVGVIVAQTGPLAVVGTTIKNGLILSQRQNYPQNRLRLVIEDDGFQPKNTVAAFQKLMLTEKPGVFITFGSSTTLAIAPLAEQAKVPVVAITIVEAATKGRHYVFRWAVSSSSLDANSAREMSAAGVKSVAIVTTLQDGMLELRNHFINTPGFKVVVDEEFLPSETDFHAVITRIKSAAPDAIYMALLPPQGSLFAKQLDNLDLRQSFSPEFRPARQWKSQIAKEHLRVRLSQPVMTAMPPNFMPIMLRHFQKSRLAKQLMGMTL